ICGLTIHFLSTVVVHCSWTLSQRKTPCSAVLDRHGWVVLGWWILRLQDSLSRVTGFLDRLRRSVSTDDHDWRVHEAVSHDRCRPWPDIRNADPRILPRLDATGDSTLDVA